MSNISSIPSDSFTNDIDLFSFEENEFSKIEIKDLIVDDKDKNNYDYICPICKSFLHPDECMELKCGHLFCSDCMNSLNEASFTLSVKCPLCNEKTSNVKYIKNDNKFAYKILCNIKIYCPNPECKTVILAGNLKDHLKKCDFELVNCAYCDTKNIFRKNLKKHLVENIDTHFLKLINEVEELKEKVNKKN